MKLARTVAVSRKEMLHILRDPRSLAMALALPAVMLLLFGYALTLDVDRIPLLIQDNSNSTESRLLISYFEGSEYFQVMGSSDDYSMIEQWIDRGDAMGALVVSSDFARALQSGRHPQVQLLLDGSDSNTASIALGYAQSIVQMFEGNFTGAQMGPPPGLIQLDLRIWYNPELESRNYIVPGLLAVILMIIAALLTSLTIAREWEMGTMEQLLSTPVRPSELVLGKMSAYFALGVIDTVVSVVVGVFVFAVPLRGSLLLLAFSSLLFLFGALCWGILISAVARTQLMAYQMGMITSFLPAFLLSGFIFAIESMPLPVQLATYLVPARYYISALKGIFLKGVGMEVVGIELLFLAIFALIVFLITVRKVRAKIA